MQETHLGSANDSELQQVHVEGIEEDRFPPPNVEGILKQAGSTLSQFNLKIYHFWLTRTKARWVPITSATQSLKKANNLFSIIAVAAFISSTWLVSLSITTRKPVGAAFARMILYIFQVYRALESRIKTRERQSDQEKSRFNKAK